MQPWTPESAENDQSSEDAPSAESIAAELAQQSPEDALEASGEISQSENEAELAAA